MPAAAGITERTRATIVQALADVLTHEHPAAVSVPAVAARAGVSVRTVYRYFPTKAALLDAAASRFQERVAPVPPTGAGGDLQTYLHQMWSAFGSDVEAVRAEHLSPAGRALRARRLPGSRRLVRDAVSAQAPWLEERERDALADLIITVTGSATFLELVDRLGHAPADAADLAAWAVQAMISAAERDGAVGRTRERNDR